MLQEVRDKVTRRGISLEKLHFKIYDLLKTKLEPIGMKHEINERERLERL